MVDDFVKLVNAATPLLLAIATLLGAYTAFRTRQIHINTNSTLSEARAARDEAIQARKVAEAALAQTKGDA